MKRSRKCKRDEYAVRGGDRTDLSADLEAELLDKIVRLRKALLGK